MNREYHIEARPFLVRWIVYSVVVWPMAILCGGLIAFGLSIISASVQNLASARSVNDALWLLAIPWIGATIGFCVGHLQRNLLRKRLYWAADRWRVMSTIGGALGSLIVVGALALLGDRAVNFDDLLIFAMPVFMLFVSIAQWVRLRHAVRNSWLWLASNVAAGLVFSGFVFMNQPDWSSNSYSLLMLGLWFLGIVAQGAITGQIMLYLFQTQLHPMQPEDIPTTSEQSRSVWDEAI